MEAHREEKHWRSKSINTVTFTTVFSKNQFVDMDCHRELSNLSLYDKQDPNGLQTTPLRLAGWMSGAAVYQCAT